MSNSLAVAIVTAALSRILGEALASAPSGGVPHAKVSTLRPDMLANADGDAPSLNVFLYQVVANGAWTGADLPTRRPDGTVLTRPQQALDLHYLLTVSGDETALEPQRILGVAVSTLVARPVLSREVVRNIIKRAQHDDTWERYSDLANQIDVVRFTLLPLNLEEMSKLWSTFFQAPYRLSVAYQAGVVLLDSDVNTTPQPALPVLTRGIDVSPFQVPSITRVVADSSPTDPVVPGTTLRIEGQRLRGPSITRVRLDGVEVTVAADQVTGTQLTVGVPAGVAAGIRAVQVLHPRMVGTRPAQRLGAESNAAALVVRPVVSGPVTAAPGNVAGAIDITVPLNPPVGKPQRVVLTLNEHHPPADHAARAYSFVAPPLDPDGPETAAAVTVPTLGVAAGDYLVRVQVDGAESVLAVGVDGRYDEPRVTIPCP